MDIDDRSTIRPGALSGRTRGKQRERYEKLPHDCSWALKAVGVFAVSVIATGLAS
jgi:hypothetical protein